MSDLTRYRINKSAILGGVHSMQLYDYIRDGVLLPDTALQDIANAWNEIDAVTRRMLSVHSEPLGSLLDALTQEDTP